MHSTKVNILLVDDNESNLLALETILEGEDRNLVRAASGDEALQYLLHNDVAVVLLDVRMPGISGLETAELIRGRRKTHDVPIIFLTAYDSVDKQDLSIGYSLGAVDYIIKPFDPHALKSKVAVFVELFKKTEQVKQQAALLHEKNIELENANFQRLGKLVELGQRLMAERDPRALLQLFCDAACDILGAGCARVKISDFEAGSGKETGRIYEAILNAGRAEDRPIRLSPAEALDARAALAAPIALPEQPTGWLYLLDKLEGGGFSEADERLAMTLTAQLAVAYENARLYADVQRQACELLDEVAERKQAQEEKEKLLISEKAARLEAEQAQRLSSELLLREKQARSEAETANRLKDEFLATVSHELRTPLNSILGWSQLMRTETLDGEGRARALDTIERNTKSLAQIIDDLLDVSRIISGKLRLEARPIDLARVIEAALDAIRPAADAKSIGLHVSVDSKARVSGDPNRLQQVAWNLLSNAIKFTPAGGSVAVRLERRSSNARITVTDNGEGIAEEFLPYVFDRFRQADSTFARMHGGLGLGLAIVRHLVEMHGGTVQAESAGRGKGATFTVTFPLVAVSTGALKTAPGVERSQEDSRQLAGLRVMVVDDERDARELLVAMLEQRGAAVIAAGSVAEALMTLDGMTNGSMPDVLISDIGMPAEDGFEFIRKVRAMAPDRGGRIPAIALTAYARAEDRARALEAGFERHLAKPVEPATLASAVANLAHRVANA
jgi:signal transduction histidine kinase/DNA-binding response OmpR family regulator